jgi:hypothetical protein
MCQAVFGVHGEGNSGMCDYFQAIKRGCEKASRREHLTPLSRNVLLNDAWNECVTAILEAYGSVDDLEDALIEHEAERIARNFFVREIRAEKRKKTLLDNMNKCLKHKLTAVRHHVH